MDIVTYFTVMVFVGIFSSGDTIAQGGGAAAALPCIHKLLPCQPYLHAVNPPPPPSCCVPMKEIVKKDVPCLCNVFNNPEMLKSLNLTKENALDLPKACGANADVSLCTKTAASPPFIPSSPSIPSPPGSIDGNTSTKTTKSAAPSVRFIGFSFVSAFVATFFF